MISLSDKHDLVFNCGRRGIGVRKECGVAGWNKNGDKERLWCGLVKVGIRR
jgi:hypothetical protein